MNFDLHEVSTHVSDSTTEILRIQLQNAGEPQSQKKEEGGDAHVPPLSTAARCFLLWRAWGPLSTWFLCSAVHLSLKAT